NHLLWAFLQNPQGYFSSILSHIGAKPQSLLRDVEGNLEKLATYSGPEKEPPSASRSLQSRIADAQNIAQSWKDSYTSSDHFLISYWKNGGDPFASWKKSTKLSLNQVEEQIKKIRGDRHMDSPGAESNLQALEKYCKN